jgi:hypothetical protein
VGKVSKEKKEKKKKEKPSGGGDKIKFPKKTEIRAQRG